MREEYGDNRLPAPIDLVSVLNLFWGGRIDRRVALLNYTVSIYAAYAAATLVDTSKVRCLVSMCFSS